MSNGKVNSNSTLRVSVSNLCEKVNNISYEQEVCIRSMIKSMVIFEDTNSLYASCYVAKNRVERILEEEYNIYVKITILCFHGSISINVEGR